MTEMHWLVKIALQLHAYQCRWLADQLRVAQEEKPTGAPPLREGS